MRQFLNKTAFAALACAFPMAVWADNSGAATLNVGQALAFDSGTTGSSGDIVFTGTGLSLQGGAKGLDLGNVGATEYNAINGTESVALKAAGSIAPIPLSLLTAGNVFVVLTIGGNIGKAMVTASSSTSITFQYATYGNTTGGGGGGGAPTISGITNNYSFIPTGFVNSGIPPSSIFVIFGSNMATAPAGTLSLNRSDGNGLPTTDAGATLTVNAGGNTYHPAMYYASPSQIAGVLPAGVPVGPATISVNYSGGNSNAFSFQVVSNALGLDSYYGGGSGLVTATDALTGALVTYTNSAKPMQTLTFWGSGNGADPQDSDSVFTTTPHSVNQANTAFYIGGVAATVLYAGSSGYPGLNQINVQVPSSITTGCGNSAVAVTNGVASNFGSLPVNQGGGPCNDSIFGISGSTINSLSGQTTVRSGTTFLGQLVTPMITENVAFAGFSSTTGAFYGATTGITSIGSCFVTEVISTTGVTGTTTALDAGNVSVQGPTGTFPLSAFTKGSYTAQLPATAITSTGGAFVFTGGGGADVGPFTSTVNLPNPLLNWTNQSAAATITRGNGLLVTWSGGASGSYVIIEGNSAGPAGTSGSYGCYAPQSAGQFMVPAYVTGTLPAGTGTTLVENGTSFTPFSAPTLDYGIGFGFSGVQVNSTYK